MEVEAGKSSSSIELKNISLLFPQIFYAFLMIQRGSFTDWAHELSLITFSLLCNLEGNLRMGSVDSWVHIYFSKVCMINCLIYQRYSLTDPRLHNI